MHEDAIVRTGKFRGVVLTVIAAIRLNDIPVLIGDTLLTAPATPSDPIEVIPGNPLPRNYYPANPATANTLPGATGYGVAGARRKVVIVNDFFCVGWSGGALCATALVKRLREMFGKGITTFDALKAFLGREEPITGGLAFLLVGWFIDDSRHCFRWNSAWPSDVYEGDDFIDGSGENILVNIRAHDVAADGNVKGGQLVQCKAAALITKCAAVDVFTGLSTRNHFGYFFEIIYWDGQKFNYVDEYTMAYWTIAESEGKLLTQHSPLIQTYRASDRYCVLQTHQSRTGYTFLDVVSDGTDSLDDVDPRILGPLPIRSKILCNFFRVIFPDGRVGFGPVITEPDGQDFCWIEDCSGKEHIMINVRNVYEHMKGAQVGPTVVV